MAAALAAAGLVAAALLARRAQPPRKPSGSDPPQPLLSSGDIVVVMEQCYCPMNWENVLRTCVALGVLDIQLIQADRGVKGFKLYENGRNRHLMGKEAERAELEGRLAVTQFATAADFLSACERDGLEVWATDLSQHATDLSDALYRRRRRSEDGASKSASSTAGAGGGGRASASGGSGRIALVFGREAVGVSKEVLEGAQERVYFPLHGFSDSLNVSASVALILDAMLA